MWTNRFLSFLTFHFLSPTCLGSFCSNANRSTTIDSSPSMNTYTRLSPLHRYCSFVDLTPNDYGLRFDVVSFAYSCAQHKCIDINAVSVCHCGCTKEESSSFSITSLFSWEEQSINTQLWRKYYFDQRDFCLIELYLCGKHLCDACVCVECACVPYTLKIYRRNFKTENNKRNELKNRTKGKRA